MFLGEYQTKFSGRGRVILPKLMRQALGKEKVIILSKGFEGCIWGFSQIGFEKEAEKQLEVSSIEEKARYLRRYLFSSSVEAELDAQGRFIIPSALLLYAQLGEEVVIIGAGDHFEIWDKKMWEVQLKRLEDEYGRVS